MKTLDQLKNEVRMSTLDATAEHNYVRAMVPMVEKHFVDKEIVEIGSFEGGSTELFAMFCRSVVSVDPYETGDSPKQDGGKETLRQARATYNIRMKEYSNVKQVLKKSIDAAKEVKSKSLDGVYVDANHTYQQVISDIRAWFPKIKVGGFIAGHDYYEAPKQAINDILGEPDETFPDASWIFAKTKDLKLKKIGKK